MKTVVLIQARMGSSRLPGKMLLPLGGVPVVDWVVHRVGKALLADRIIVATTDSQKDDPLVRHLAQRGLACFRGPEDDVLERFRLAAGQAGAGLVVRVCADNPFIWGGEIDRLITRYRELSGRAPEAGQSGESLPEERLYVYNHIPKANLYPDGLGAEAVSFRLLTGLARKAVLPAHREHCFSYIWDTPEEFDIRTFDPPDPALCRPHIRLDLDTIEDYRRLGRMNLNPDSDPREVLREYDRTRSEP